MIQRLFSVFSVTGDDPNNKFNGNDHDHYSELLDIAIETDDKDQRADSLKQIRKKGCNYISAGNDLGYMMIGDWNILQNQMDNALTNYLKAADAGNAKAAKIIEDYKKTTESNIGSCILLAEAYFINGYENEGINYLNKCVENGLEGSKYALHLQKKGPMRVLKSFKEMHSCLDEFRWRVSPNLIMDTSNLEDEKQKKVNDFARGFANAKGILITINEEDHIVELSHSYMERVLVKNEIENSKTINIQIRERKDFITASESIMNGICAKIDFSECVSELAQECFDILAGQIYGLSGDIDKESNNIFVFMPHLRESDGTETQILQTIPDNNENEILKYKTKGNASPQGRPRVYFCCHKNDFDKLFSIITDEILDVQKNAAIWYRDPLLPFTEDERFLNDLSQMQLFVIPVTSRFLYKDDPARTIEMAYAVNKHIPVLPLMQESGLESDFNRICGAMQFLDKNASSTDMTVLPYEEKLKKYLESVLISDEQAARIREAFDAYIFLSYRKKDRADAQKIMRLIHKNEFCRDIAIWYDEFLTPGENFNNEIEAAMKKSRLFALVVTPSLLEDPNYVLTNEYPASVEMGKARIPIEARDTDSTILQKMYEGIGDCYQIMDPEAVGARLHELLLDIALNERKDDPAHNFLIGLAYLTGIDVEVDHERAVELISGAANADLPEAYEKLVAMYRNGEGVERNYHTSVEWQVRYVSYLKKNAEEKDTLEAYEKLILGLSNLGDYHIELCSFADARRVYVSVLECAKILKRRGSSQAGRDMAISFEKLGNICVAEGRLTEAKEWYEKSLEISVALAEETGTIGARRDLSISYCKLGDIYGFEGRLTEARELFEKGLEINAALVEETGTISARRDLSISFERLGNICVAEGRLTEAKEWYEKELEICAALVEEMGTIGVRRDLSVSYYKLGDIFMTEGRLTEAKELYEKGLEISVALAEETGTIEARRDLSISYNKLGNICMAEGRLTEAKEWYEKGLEGNSALVEETGTIEARRDLSVSYYKLGDIYGFEERLTEARALYEKALEISVALAEETGTIEARRDLFVSYNKLGDICESEGRRIEAKEWYEKELEICVALAEETGTIEARSDLSVSFERLGNIYKAVGRLTEAKELYEKGLEINVALAKETGTISARRDLSVSYYKLGNTCMAEGRLTEAKEWYEKELEICAALAEETGTIEARRDLSVSYYKLGDIFELEGRLTEAKEWYEKGLDIRTKLYNQSASSQALEDLSFAYNRIIRVCEALGDINETEKWREKKDSIKRD